MVVSHLIGGASRVTRTSGWRRLENFRQFIHWNVRLHVFHLFKLVSDGLAKFEDLILKNVVFHKLSTDCELMRASALSCWPLIVMTAGSPIDAAEIPAAVQRPPLPPPSGRCPAAETCKSRRHKFCDLLDREREGINGHFLGGHVGKAPLHSPRTELRRSDQFALPFVQTVLKV